MLQVVLLSDDDFLAGVLETYMRRDDIEIERARSAKEAVQRVAAGAGGVILDLAKRGLTGDAIMAISGRAEHFEVPMMIVSAQPRRDLSEFAAVVRATEVLSKTDSMTSTAARIRLCVRTPMKKKPAAQSSEHLDWALA